MPEPAGRASLNRRGRPSPGAGAAASRVVPGALPPRLCYAPSRSGLRPAFLIAGLGAPHSTRVLYL